MKLFLKKKEAIPFEVEDSPKIRRAKKFLNNFLDKGLNYYEENNNGLKSNFTDALIVKDGKMLFLQRAKDSKVEPEKWGFPGGHLEKLIRNNTGVSSKNFFLVVVTIIGCPFTSCSCCYFNNWSLGQ